MSRVGNNSIEVPDNVDFGVVGKEVTVKGKLGQLSICLVDEIKLEQVNGEIVLKPRSESIHARRMWGTTRNLINNLIIGVNEGFSKNLEISGVGYRAQIQGKNVLLSLGFSHDITYPIPQDIDIKCPDQTHVIISGIDKQKVGQVAAEIRRYRPPEPYKGKGIRYKGEYVVRKEGKKK